MSFLKKKKLVYRRRSIMKTIILCVALLMGNTMTAYSSQIVLSNRSITDDEIANAIKAPRPASITTVKNFIDKKFKSEEIEEIDLSSNNICNKGATDFFIYSAKNFPNIRELDLSLNRIRDLRGTQENEEFEKSLQTLLELPNFQKLILKTNYLGSNWYQYISDKLPKKLSKKIIWG